MLNIPNTDRIDQSARTIGRKENEKEKKKDKRAISERALCQKKEKIALHICGFTSGHHHPLASVH